MGTHRGSQIALLTCVGNTTTDSSLSRVSLALVLRLSEELDGCRWSPDMTQCWGA